MSGKSSNPGEWWSALEPAPAEFFRGKDDLEDPRLGEECQRWDGTPCELWQGQPVLLAFPCDEGVRRNRGRPGAAQAPNAIRKQLYPLTTWDPLAQVDLTTVHLLDLGDIRMAAQLEIAQGRLGATVGELLMAGTVPIVLGGGHETAFGHYLGYVAAGLECGIINIDAHLDVRPYADGGHSGSPFRQAIEYAAHPLKSGRYVVIGAQRQSVAKAHAEFVQEHGGRIHWLEDCQKQGVGKLLTDELNRLGGECGAVFVTVDADAFRQTDVPGASAPSAVGLHAESWPDIAFRAGCNEHVRSIEIVEVNPLYDRDNQTVRWAALGIRQFLVGLAQRHAAD